MGPKNVYKRHVNTVSDWRAKFGKKKAKYATKYHMLECGIGLDWQVVRSCDVKVLWSPSLEYFDNNFTDD